jgi:hypothetical protein
MCHVADFDRPAPLAAMLAALSTHYQLVKACVRLLRFAVWLLQFAEHTSGMHHCTIADPQINNL